MFANLTESEKQIILGTILGDGYIQKTSRYHHLMITHSIVQREYLQWIYDHLPNIPKPEALIEYARSKLYSINGRVIHPKPQVYLCSRQHPFFSDVHATLYSNGQKIITRRFLNLLGPQAIAIWWCDDGCCYYNRKQRHALGWFSTQSMGYSGNLLIQRWFRVIWGIDSRVDKIFHKDMKQVAWRIRFNATNMKRLRLLIKEYIPDCMKYKVDMHYSDPAMYNVDFLPTRTLIKTVEKGIVRPVDISKTTE